MHAVEEHARVSAAVVPITVVFGLFRLLGYRFSPRLADIGGTRFWRIDSRADYGPQAAGPGTSRGDSADHEPILCEQGRVDVRANRRLRAGVPRDVVGSG